MAAALATESSSNVQEMLDIEQNKSNERAQWVLNAPKPPGFWQELVNSVRETFFPHRRKFKNEHDGFNLVFTFLNGLFPILHWCRNYKASKFRNDLMAGLTLASLCIPQVVKLINFLNH